MQKNLPRVFLFVDGFNSKDLASLNKNIDIIYRNYKKKINKSILLSLKNFCRKQKRKFYISNNIKLAIELDIDGVYIPSFNKKLNLLNINTRKNFSIIGSAHNKREVITKNLQNCNLIFLAPLFKTIKNKKNLNISKFNLITLGQKKKFIALGGINEKNFNQLYLTNSVGFAGIRWLKKNGPRKFLRPFLKI
jgi:thiamine-phosphate pyrophosphorylase